MVKEWFMVKECFGLLGFLGSEFVVCECLYKYSEGKEGVRCKCVKLKVEEFYIFVFFFYVYCYFDDSGEELMLEFIFL